MFYYHVIRRETAPEQTHPSLRPSLRRIFVDGCHSRKVGRNERINYAKGLLQREFLPHVGIGAGTEAKKVRARGLPQAVHALLCRVVGPLPCRSLSDLSAVLIKHRCVTRCLYPIRRAFPSSLSAYCLTYVPVPIRGRCCRVHLGLVWLMLLVLSGRVMCIGGTVIGQSPCFDGAGRASTPSGVVERFGHVVGPEEIRWYETR